MNKETHSAGSGLPKAKIESRKRSFSVTWIVPIVAALVAGYLIFNRSREFGSTISIEFRNVEGVKSGQTPLQYRGVVIGEVSGVELSKDQQHAILKVKLRRFASSLARTGSTFWIVRPELGMGSVTGLGTIITGPHLEVLPGNGGVSSEFVGAEISPLALEPQGLKIILLSSHAGSLRAGAPLYYRGIEVGTVQESQLHSNAMCVEIDLVVKQRYAKLLRSGSKFWNVTGLDVKFGIFRGAEINVESLKSLVIGGIAFATPDDPKDKPVEDGTVFPLLDEPKKEWLDWSPNIPLPPVEIQESIGPSSGSKRPDIQIRGLNSP